MLTRLVGTIPAEALAEAEPSLIEVARGMDPTALGVYLTHLIATWVEPVFDAEQRSQETKRFLTTGREADGMLSGRFRLTTGDSEALLHRPETAGPPQHALADQRDAGQRRALIEMRQQLLAFGTLPDAGGFRPGLSYVVPAGWATGHPPDCTFAELVQASLARTRPLDDLTSTSTSTAGSAGAGSAGAGQRPLTDCCASGAWTGPQTRARIETLLCDARITRVLLQPHGQVATLQTLTDPVTKAQRKALGGPRPRLRRPRLHPATGVLRRPPPRAPRARRLHPSGQPGPALPTPPPALAPRPPGPAPPEHPLAHQPPATRRRRREHHAHDPPF